MTNVLFEVGQKNAARALDLLLAITALSILPCVAPRPAVTSPTASAIYRVPSSAPIMRLTAELINNSLAYLNPLNERELDLRGTEVLPDHVLKRTDATQS